MPPQLIFGSATFGTDSLAALPEVETILQTLKSLGITRIDTAARYGGGASEKLLGQAGAGEKHGFEIDTKIMFAGDGKGTLTPEAIAESIKESLQRLQIKQISTLYIHAPDPQTQPLSSLRALTAHHAQGHFLHLGLSNFTVPQVREWYSLAQQHDLLLPTVYQGQYNLLARICETPLPADAPQRERIPGRNDEPGMLPVLRELGFQFNAHSPLAWGVLTGKLLREKEGAEGRKAVEGSRLQEGKPGRQMVMKLYEKDYVEEGLRRLEKVCEGEGIGLAECALRWVVWHSELREGDGVLLGASRVEQVRENVEWIRKGELSKAVRSACEVLGEEMRKGEMGEG